MSRLDGPTCLVEAFVHFLGGYKMDNFKSVAEPLPSAKTSGLAIASLILGILGFFTCGLTGIVGLILGIIGFCAIKQRAEELKGLGLAIAGIVVSAISFIVVPFIAIMMVILMPALTNVRTQARMMASASNARQICLAMMMYCDENDGNFPPSDNWPDALAPYFNNNRALLTSTFNPEAGRAYAMNAQLDGWKVRDIRQPHRTVLIFEARFGGPPAGGRELLPESPRGRRGYIIGFLDGHVECIRPGRLDELIWVPGTQPFVVR
jgi:hypothetical protein